MGRDISDDDGDDDVRMVKEWEKRGMLTQHSNVQAWLF